MATLNIADVYTTAESFHATVKGITIGDDFRFYLYYDNGGGNRTAIVDGEKYKATTTSDKEFKATGLGAERDLLYTIYYLPNGKTDWTKEDDIVYLALRSSIKTKPDEPAKVWPGDWTKWANLKAGDPTTAVTADDWNDFLDHINAVIDYKGGTKVTLTKVSKGDEMKANYFNSGAATAMRSIGLSPPSAKQGDPITADFFVQYGKALNAAK